MPNFLPTDGFKLVDPKKLDSNRFNSNRSKSCVLEVDLEYFNKLCELYNDYSLVLDKTKIKWEMLCNYQFNITDFYKISIDNTKRLLPRFFDEEIYVIHYENLQLYLQLG